MKKINLAFFILSLLMVYSCRKDEIKKTDGPSLEEIYGVFSIKDSLQVSKDTVDFSIGQSTYFTAAMSKTSDWKITITGQISGAQKIITGTSKILEPSVVIWDGSTTNFPMFKVENCKVEMTFTGEVDTITRFIYVKGIKSNPGYLIADFETGFKAGWTSFVQSGANMDFQIHTDATAPQGGSYFNMQGTVNWDYLIGLVNFKASAEGAVTYPLNPNPSSEYFNVLVYGEPGITNAIILFQFLEDEDANGTFDAASEDEYDYQINVDWAGWKLISVKYSDLVTLVNGVAGTPKGNQQLNPDKLTQINMLHLADPATGFSKSKLDYIIFTENAPLNP